MSDVKCWACGQVLGLMDFKTVSDAGVRHSDRDVCLKHLMERLAEARTIARDYFQADRAAGLTVKQDTLLAAHPWLAKEAKGTSNE